MNSKSMLNAIDSYFDALNAKANMLKQGIIDDKSLTLSNITGVFISWGAYNFEVVLNIIFHSTQYVVNFIYNNKANRLDKVFIVKSIYKVIEYGDGYEGLIYDDELVKNNDVINEILDLLSKLTS